MQLVDEPEKELNKMVISSLDNTLLCQSILKPELKTLAKAKEFPVKDHSLLTC